MDFDGSGRVGQVLTITTKISIDHSQELLFYSIQYDISFARFSNALYRI